MIFEEKVIDSEIIYRGKILNLRRDTVTAKKGKATREIVEHNGAVAVVALTDENKVVMVRQYRCPLKRVVLEIPAGKIEKGESDPAEVAARELKEETGYTAKNTRWLGKINPSVGYTEEGIDLFLCTELTPGETDFDEDEAIDIEEYDFNKIYQMAASGELVDAKSICGLFMAKEQWDRGSLL